LSTKLLKGTIARHEFTKKTKYEKILTAKKKPRRCSKKNPQRQETYFGYQVINERAAQGVVSRWQKLCDENTAANRFRLRSITLS
jgi:hypothetical protein